jgi:hypothetical protein
MNIEEAVRRAAAAGPAYAGDLAKIQRHGRRYAHRRTAVRAGAVTAVLGVGSTFLAWSHHSTPTVAATPSAATSESPSPSPSPVSTNTPWSSDQRLILISQGWSISGADRRVEVDGSGLPSMMRPDGKIVTFTFGNNTKNWVDQFIPLPDGRFVVLRDVNVGSHTVPDPAHPDGPSNPDLRTRLQILDSAQKVRLSHEVRHIGEYVELLGATADSAYLGRPKGLYLHDFATGRETLVIPARVLGADLSQPTSALQVSVEGGRLAIARGDLGKPWFIDVFDLSTGQRVSSYSLNGVAAVGAAPIRLSPDGRRVAFLYRTRSDSRVAVLDVATQALAVDTSLVDPSDTAGQAGWDFDLRVRGVAWSDNQTVRVAWAQLPPDAHGKYNYDKITSMRTIVVG